ncbi:MAG: hypothetical protein WBA10_12790 [Elainellaceae cyanobacterium]
MELFAYLEAFARHSNRRSEDAALQDAQKPTSPINQHKAVTNEGDSTPKSGQTSAHQAHWQDDGIATTWWV